MNFQTIIKQSAITLTSFLILNSAIAAEATTNTNAPNEATTETEMDHSKMGNMDMATMMADCQKSKSADECHKMMTKKEKKRKSTKK